MQVAGLEPSALHPNFTATSLLVLALFLCSHQTGGSSKGKVLKDKESEACPLKVVTCGRSTVH